MSVEETEVTEQKTEEDGEEQRPAGSMMMAVPPASGRRVFINRVDRYIPSHIARHLSGCAVGATKKSAGGEDEVEEGEEEEEEGGDGEGEGRKSRASKAIKSEGLYSVTATLSEESKISSRLNFPLDVVPMMKSREKMFTYLMSCDFIIYDVTSDDEAIEEAADIVTRLEAELEGNETAFSSKIFILLANLMNWARTGPLNKEDSAADQMLSEDDYRRRKPHPDYKNLFELEKNVIKLGRIKPKVLTTYVIGAGLPYGAEEDMLLFLFKQAWQNGETLPLYGRGRNVLPTIHVQDLASIMQYVIDMKPHTKYIVAVDESNDTLKDITKAIGKSMGTGRLARLPSDDIYLNRELSKVQIDQLQLNLRIDPVIVKNDFSFQWTSDSGLVSNIGRVIKEFRISRRLKPMRVVILGPPGSGKTTVSKQLAENFRIHHLTIKSIIDDAEEKMTRFLEEKERKLIEKQEKLEEAENEAESGEAEKKEQEGEEGEEEEEDEDNEDADDGEDEAAEAEEMEALAGEYEALLEEMRESREASEGGTRLDDSLLHRLILDRLKSHPCRNQGFILDGFPRTIDEARTLLVIGEDEEGDEGEGEDKDDDDQIVGAESGDNEQQGAGEGEGAKTSAVPPLRSFAKPEFTFMLEAPDGFLVDRIVNLPEQVVTGTHNTSTRFLERLARFRSTTGDERPDVETLFSLFDELDLSFRKIDICEDDTLRMRRTAAMIERIMGKPRNFGPTEAELEEMSRRQTEAKMAEEEQERLEKERHDAAEVDARRKMQDHWLRHRENVILQEQEEMEVRALPLRNYLMIHVMPTLTAALVDCCNTRPADPIDFLAACLFRSNQQVD